jgi:hypothetical protein
MGNSRKIKNQGQYFPLQTNFQKYKALSMKSSIGQLGAYNNLLELQNADLQKANPRQQQWLKADTKKSLTNEF